jgi:hypothetical protein
MFRTVPLSIIRSSSLYIQESYVIQVCWQLASRTRMFPPWSYSQAVSKLAWHIRLQCLQWKTSDDGQRNCPKHVDFHSKSKFEKLVHLVGLIIRNLTRCTVTWTSNQRKIFVIDFTLTQWVPWKVWRLQNTGAGTSHCEICRWPSATSQGRNCATGDVDRLV